MGIQEDIALGGRSVVITGGASGIGRSCGEYLAGAGMRVALWDVDEAAGAAAAAGMGALFVPCDVTQDASCRYAAERSRRELGRIDCLVNCAGVIRRGTVAELSEREWDLVIDVCLKGAFLVSRHVIPIMVANGGGKIVNIASGWGISGGERAAAYCAAKGGVVNLTRAMAIDHGPENIQVNCVCPGDVETPLLYVQAEQLGCDLDGMLSSSAMKRPLRRIGQPEDVARAVAFFLSGLSSWSAGAVLTVDGGGTA